MGNFYSTPLFFFPLVIAWHAYFAEWLISIIVKNTNLYAFNRKRQITSNKDTIGYLYF